MSDESSTYEGLPVLRAEILGQRVYEALREAIVDGSLSPGQRVVESRVSKSMGVSRSLVREAIRRLEQEQLLTSVPGRGLSVISLDLHDVQEIYELRSALECWAVRKICSTISPEELDELEDFVRQMAEASEHAERDSLTAQDVAFHQKICELAGNERLLAAWRGMMTQIQLLSAEVIGSLYSNLSDVPERHKAVVAAIRSRDVHAAEQAMRDHISSVAAQVQQRLRASKDRRPGE